MINIYLKGLMVESESDINSSFNYVYNDQSYTPNQLKNAAKLIPIKSYDISYIKTILRNTIYKIEQQDIFKLAKIIKNIVNTPKDDYLLVLKLDDHDRYDLVYGHDLLIRTLIDDKRTINVKLLDHSFFSNLFYSLRKTKNLS